MYTAIILSETKEKKCILDTYEEHVGLEFDHSIVSKKIGKIKQDPNFNRSCMKPSFEKMVSGI
jgi:hypothetical protein